MTARSFATLPLSAVLASCSLSACKPLERPDFEDVTVVREFAAPGLAEYENDEPSVRTIYLGDVVSPVKRWPVLTWDGLLEGKADRRTGEVVELQESKNDATRFSFASSVTSGLRAPTSAWFCDKLGNPAFDRMPCTASLRRIVAPDGTAIAYQPCAQPYCRIAVVRDGVLRLTKLDGLLGIRLFSTGPTTYAVAFTRWVRAPNWTGATAVIYEVSPSFRRAAEVLAEEIDARDEFTVKTRLGRLVVTPGELEYAGTVSQIDRSTGQPLGAVEAVRTVLRVTSQGQVSLSR